MALIIAVIVDSNANIHTYAVLVARHGDAQTRYVRYVFNACHPITFEPKIEAIFTYTPTLNNQIIGIYLASIESILWQNEINRTV